MTNFVQMYRSTDLNSPVLSGESGKLVDLLNAVLVTGYTTAALTAPIAGSGTTATATITAANTTLETGNWVTISGCTGTDASLFNGTFQITVDSSTQFHYTTTSALSGNSTGTPVYAKAGLGWTKPHSDTGRGAFLPQAVTGYPRFYLYMNDNSPVQPPDASTYRQAAVRGYKTMSNIDSGTSPFPTAAQQATGICWRKSASTDATARPWVLVGNGRTFYFVPNSDNSLSAGRGFYGFGGFESFKVGDENNCFINGWAGFNGTFQSAAGVGLAYGNTVSFSTTGGSYAACGLAQTGPPVLLANFVGFTNGAYGLGAASTSHITYPAPADTGVWFQQPLIFETALTTPRGRLSGFYVHCHSTFPTADGDKVSGVGNLSGASLVCVSITSSSIQGQVHLDVVGPW